MTSLKPINTAPLNERIQLYSMSEGYYRGQRIRGPNLKGVGPILVCLNEEPAICYATHWKPLDENR